MTRFAEFPVGLGFSTTKHNWTRKAMSDDCNARKEMWNIDFCQKIKNLDFDLLL